MFSVCPLRNQEQKGSLAIDSDCFELKPYDAKLKNTSLPDLGFVKLEPKHAICQQIMGICSVCNLRSKARNQICTDRLASTGSIKLGMA